MAHTPTPWYLEITHDALVEALRLSLPHLDENFRWHRDAQSHAGRVTAAYDALEAAKAALALATPVTEPVEG